MPNFLEIRKIFTGLTVGFLGKNLRGDGRFGFIAPIEPLARQ
jgi:hypothetical protein